MVDNLIPQYFRVTIANMTAAAPGDGFIDDILIEQYGRDGAYPTTLELARTKARGNFRFRRVCEELNVMQTVSHLFDFNRVGGDEDTEHTTFEFTVVYDRIEYVFTRDELYPEFTATEFLYGSDAIKRAIARIFITNFITKAEFPRNPDIANQGYEWIREDLLVSGPNNTGNLNTDIASAEGDITVVPVNFTNNLS